MKAAKDYRTHHVVQYERPNSTGYTSIPVLEFLWGQPWDDLCLRWVHALRPSGIRVTTGVETCDARTWRVTVYVDDSDRIKSIRQEVEIAGGSGWDLHRDWEIAGRKLP